MNIIVCTTGKTYLMGSTNRWGRRHAVMVHHVVFELGQPPGPPRTLMFDVDGRQGLRSTDQAVVQARKYITLEKISMF